MLRSKNLRAWAKFMGLEDVLSDPYLTEIVKNSVNTRPRSTLTNTQQKVRKQKNKHARKSRRRNRK
jgi:hypothetical protein